jgi:hypothetical protein
VDVIATVQWLMGFLLLFVFFIWQYWYLNSGPLLAKQVLYYLTNSLDFFALVII